MTMRIVVTGATGQVGHALVPALGARGHQVTVLTRHPARAEVRLAAAAVGWRPTEETAPRVALAGSDAVVHLLGEDVGQRWTPDAKRAIHESRLLGTRNLVAALHAVEPRPRVLISGSGYTYYGPRGDEEVTEAEPPGNDFLADTAIAWENEAHQAAKLGLRVVLLRTGLVLDATRDGTLARMVRLFRFGAGGPLGSGRQWMPWIHRDDVAGIIAAALEDDRWSGPANAVAPSPVRNRDFARTLGRVLRRPAIVRTPAFALRLAYGEMSRLVTEGVRAVPARARALGYEFGYPELEPALRTLVAELDAGR